jgi:hypothetical protein
MNKKLTYIQKTISRSDVREIVHEELNLSIPDWSDKIIKTLSEKIDLMYEKLDKFVGDIQDKRDEQELHVGLHDKQDERLDRHHQRLSKLEKSANLPVVIDD